MIEKLNKRETWGTFVMFALHVFIFPLLLGVIAAFLPGSLTEPQLNLIYYLTSLVLCILFFGKLLAKNFDTFLGSLKHCLVTFAIGWGVYFVLNLVCALVMSALGLGENNANNEAIGEMLGTERGIMVIMTIVLAPIVEECIFRAGIFGGLYRKNRIVAYIVSMVIFSVYHLWQYAIAYHDISYLLNAIAYLPASFVLCWDYERTGSIWTGIFFHMSFNFVATMAM